MKVVILAGGRGTRLQEETRAKPKPMVEVGGQPILWHIMKHFAHYGHEDFYVALGYLGEVIKRFFLGYHPLQFDSLHRDFRVNLGSGECQPSATEGIAWNVNLIDTGLDTNTAGRVLRLKEHLGQEPFLLTYGDGVSNVDIDALLEFHRSHGKLATLTAARPSLRFGSLTIDDQDQVSAFHEKPDLGPVWVNAGFMVLEPAFFEYIEGDQTGLDVLSKVAEDGQLVAYKHHGYWQCLDYFRDKWKLDQAWATGAPPWKMWD